jgi:hypothetical protein
VGRILGAAVVALLLGVLFAPAKASGAPPPVPPSAPNVVEAEPVVAREVGPHTLVVRVESGYCSGDPYRPKLERVALSWRQLSPSRFAAELTAFVRTPVYSASSRAGEGPGVVQVCAGLAYDLEAKMVLPQPLARTELFDASFSPPRRMQHRPPLWFADNS